MPSAKCPFDKNHIVDEDKLLKHIQKCSSPNKINFECCKYNPLHWVNFSKLKEHEEHCNSERTNNDSTLLELIEALDNNEDTFSDFEKSMPLFSDSGMKKSKKGPKKWRSEEKEERLWEEPNFEKWVTFNQSKNNIIDLSLINNSNYSNDFSEV